MYLLHITSFIGLTVLKGLVEIDEMLLSFVIVKQTNMKYWLEIDYNIIILFDSYEQKEKF